MATAPFLQRRRLLWTGTLSVLLTALSAALDWAGYLAPLEDSLHRQRVAYCQRNVPPPSDQFVHLDIDDNVIEQVGRWPWNRTKHAEIFDEIAVAGPKVLVPDVIYSDASESGEDEEEKAEGSGRAATSAHDAALAGAVRRLGRVLIPSSLAFDPPAAPLERSLLALLINDPETTVDQCARRLRAGGASDPALDQEVGRVFLTVRERAMFERICRELAAAARENRTPGDDSRLKDLKDRLRAKLMPHADPDAVSVLDHVFDRQYDRARRERAMERFTMAVPPGLPPVLRASGQMAPVLPLAEAAACSGFVDYLPESSDGTARAVPLVAEYRGRLVPHLGLAAACAALDVDVRDLRLTPDAVIIPRPGGRDIVIPVATRRGTKVGTVGMLMQIPLFGRKDGWETMYDYPAYRTPFVKHVSLAEVWRVCTARRRLAGNERAADRLLAQVNEAYHIPADPDAAGDAAPARGPEQVRRLRETLEMVSETLKGLEAPNVASDADSAEIREKLLKLSPKLQTVLKQDEALLAQIDQLRGELRQKLGGKAVFLGGTATGRVDMQITALHHACPGVVVHGAVFNAILTGRMWRVAPPALTLTLTLALGLLAGWLSSALSPAKATVTTAALLAAYLLVNGYVLFDRRGLLVGTAGPTAAVVLVWFALTLSNFVAEVAERARITRRFRAYVDPSLVDYVLKHPDRNVFSGEVREMTVVFTDLAGFTAISEKLGPAVIPLLNELMGLISGIAKRHNGFVNKFMGDGVMFFFNAPEPNPNHAQDALAAVLAIRNALTEFNARTAKRGLPALTLRAGVCTGPMVVGDAGSAERSDYTVLGDNVNLAARLESANKATGTGCLFVERTLELATHRNHGGEATAGRFLVRPVAKLCVVGKTNAVMTYEVLARADEATEGQKRLAELTREMVEAFLDARPADCLEAVARLEEAFGESKLSHLYQDKCLRYLKDPEAAGAFTGQIALTEK